MRFIECDIPNFGDDIALLQACITGWAITGYFCNIHAPLCGQIVARGNIGINGLVVDANIWAGKISLLDDLLRDRLRGVPRDGEAESLCHIAAVRVANDQRIDADHFTPEID